MTPAEVSSNETDSEEVLRVWFGSDVETPEAVAKRSALWFASDQAFDEAIRSRFHDHVERAVASELDHWARAPRSALALVLVLDQFPRNLFRGSGRAFASDPMACRIALGAIAAGFDAQLHPVQAVFLYLPLEHAEDLALQDRCVALFERLTERAPSDLAPQFEQFSDYAARHRDVIQCFGRFPHRNQILGRASSAEEMTFLAGGGDDFGGSGG